MKSFTKWYSNVTTRTRMTNTLLVFLCLLLVSTGNYSQAKITPDEYEVQVQRLNDSLIQIQRDVFLTQHKIQLALKLETK